MYEQIIYEVEDPIATIKLNRPAQLNAWTDRMADEVKHAVARAEADPEVVVIIVTGEGRGFCAGADLKGLQNLSTGKAMEGPRAERLEADPGNPEMDASFRGRFSYLMSVRKPVIAAINGPCAGMAVPISLCCDMRFASSKAVFTTAFAQRGLIAEWGVSWTLARLVGPAHAMDLLLSARRVKADEAERIGLVNKVYPHDELMPAVYAYAREMATRCSPTSLSVMKSQVYADMTADLARANTDSQRLMVESFGRPDFEEGVQSFLEKRSPSFARV
ncbi:MAG: enoyl-CoA hydratase [Myxococcota bacterium]|jgi:enoyl-CoA hydratase/carnithine racemase|nr:enoyl-CoA hydratase [Myxococcota bacterium]